MKLSSQEKIFVGIGVVAIGLIVFFFRLYLPTNNQLNRLQDELNSTQEKLEKVKREVSTLPEIKEKTTLAKERLSILEKKLPDEQNIPEIVNLLSKELSKLDLELISLIPTSRGKREGEEMERVEIEIIMESSYRTLGEYLKTIENLPRLFKVKDLSIAKEGGNFPKLQVQLLLTTYSLAKEKEVKND